VDPKHLARLCQKNPVAFVKRTSSAARQRKHFTIEILVYAQSPQLAVTPTQPFQIRSRLYRGEYLPGVDEPHCSTEQRMSLGSSYARRTRPTTFPKLRHVFPRPTRDVEARQRDAAGTGAASAGACNRFTPL
jgi:hypothetical protein